MGVAGFEPVSNDFHKNWAGRKYPFGQLTKLENCGELGMIYRIARPKRLFHGSPPRTSPIFEIVVLYG